MKLLFVLPLILSIILHETLADSEDANVDRSKGLTAEETLGLVGHFIRRLAINSDTGSIGSSSAILNAYVDQYLVPNINQKILDNNLDPVAVPDQKVFLTLASSTLSEGVLSKLATIERYQDVKWSYDSITKKININLILRWEDLEILFKYHTKALLLKIDGHVRANVAHMKLHVNLGYCFITNHISVDAIDFDHTGAITVKFTGHKIVDWLVNAMVNAFTAIFHNLVLKVVEINIVNPVHGIVAKVNEIIDQSLNIPA